MTIFLPTRQIDGSTADVEYLDVNELADILPLHRNTIRHKLSTGTWPGVHFGRRWYMTRDDVADAVDTCRGAAAVPQIGDGPEVAPLRLGVVVSDEHVADIGDVR